MLKSLYAKGFGQLYQVDLNPHGGHYILRPISGKPYQWLTATAQQLRTHFQLFPIASVQS